MKKYILTICLAFFSVASVFSMGAQQEGPYDYGEPKTQAFGLMSILGILPTLILIAIIVIVVTTVIKKNKPEDKLSPSINESYFDGGLLSYLGWNILGFLVTILTFGICFPWALCMAYGWKINHTVINGKRLHFHGKALSLFGHWLLWILLTIITLGIYSFWLFISLEKWKVKNTTFEN
jgi:uncharacterized membrane protein YjgN (DUF898 family)